MSTVVRTDNIEQQAAARAMLDLESEAQSSGSPHHPPLRRRKEVGPAPLSSAQERLWFLDQINPHDVSANLSRGRWLKGVLNLDALKQAFSAVLARHEVLRTTFAQDQLRAITDSEPMQLIAATGSAHLSVIDFSHLPENEREQSARQIAGNQARLPFDLIMGPLLRLTLLRFGSEDSVLLLNTHRIVCDELSSEIFFEELWECYRAFVNNEPARLEDLALQYADYATWQRDWLQDEALKIQLDYWRGRLDRAPLVIELPTNRPRPAVQTWHGSSSAKGFPEELTKQLRALCEREGVTVFEMLLAAFAILLARYSRQTDIIIGSTVADRDVVETQRLIGSLASALVLRTDLSGNPTFRELLQRVRLTVREAHAHRSIPFEKLVEELRVARSLSQAPIFQVMLNLSSSDNPVVDVAGLQVEPFDFETGLSPLDLTLNVVEKAQQFYCRLEYNTDLFDVATIEPMAGHFQTLLTAIVADPDQSIAELPLLTETERYRMLREWNDTALEYPPLCVHQLFEKQAERTPDAVALVFEDEEFTYSELNARANQLARYLQKLGVGPESLVGVFVDRSLEMLVALLGIVKAGGAYLPLNTQYPHERLTLMLNDAQVLVLLTQQRLLEDLPDSGARIIAVDQDWDLIGQESNENLPSQATAENLAYVIYTSGSTGKPKGVQITHRALTNFLSSMRRQPGISPDDVMLSVTTLSFDIAGLELYLPLTVGARVVLVSREISSDSVRLAEKLKSSNATVMQATPATWRLLIEAGWQGNDQLKILCGGEALSREVADQLLKRGAAVWNLYGPTETTIWSTACRIEAKHKNIHIGRPIANTQTHVFDTKLQMVPIGVPGELYIGGDGLARGYLKRPELTAERFIPSPFAEQIGQRLYRTGDLARYLSDGNIEIMGRTDHQVKMRGFRIELGEIETVLKSHPLVRDVVVAPREGNDALVAYVVADGDQLEHSDTGALRRYVATKLPEYMVPALFVQLDSLPLTPNGKVDRRALSIPDRFQINQEQVAPRDELEANLVKIWEKVLGLKTVGIRDNFFEIGGQSLLAARLFAQIENRFGRIVPLATLFQAPTIEQLAEGLRAGGSEKKWPSLVAIQPQGSRPPLFCVHPAGANVLVFRPLARHLGTSQPLYALQAQGLDGQTRPFDRVQDMASHYVKEVRALQPEGPYFLLGASFGGLVIFEMAQELLKQGQSVALLAMLNTNCPVYSMTKRLQCHIDHFKERGPMAYLQAVAPAIMKRIGKAAQFAGTAAADDPWLREIKESWPDQDDPLMRTVLRIVEAERYYVPSEKRYPGKITLFWARDADRDLEDNRLGWRRLATGGFEVHEVPGNHTTMREEPYAAVLAEKLKACLDKAQNRRDHRG